VLKQQFFIFVKKSHFALLNMDPDGGVGGGSSMKLPHSHSTPAGVDGGTRTPPTTPKKGGKMLAVRVQMLDDSVTMFQVQVSDIWVLLL
jgi:FERM/RhoGEF/pleckstrin domain protein 2